MFRSKHVLSLEELPTEDISLALETANAMKQVIRRPVKKTPALRGKVLVNLFFEPSTRTRTSFELAAKYLGADAINFTVAQSSVVKGETLRDTARTLQAMGADAVAIRHSASGAPHFLSTLLQASILNAGDGMHEHPTQGLLDLYTIKEKKGRIDGLKVAIVGDVLHSRVARSNIWGLVKLGAKVTVCGPPTLLPVGFESIGVAVTERVEEALSGADVVYVLRLQLERQRRGLFPSTREYSRLYQVDRARLRLAKPDALLMHPGPMNRGIEISSEVADGLQSLIEEQVTNGVAVRMALLYLLLGGGRME